MARLTPPPIIAPPVGMDGRFSQAWVLWFQAVYERAGGTVQDNLDSMSLDPLFDASVTQDAIDVDSGAFDAPPPLAETVEAVDTCQCAPDRSEDIDYALGMAAFPDLTPSPEYLWKDIVFPITDRTTGAGRPTYATFMGNITAPRFAVNDVVGMESSELPHDWLQGSDLAIHVHFATNGLDATNRYVKWEIEYTYVLSSSAVGSTPSQWVTAVVVSAEAIIPANTPDRSEFLLPITTVSIPLGQIGGQWRMNVKRIAASSTAPTSDPFLSQVGIHYLADSIGSRGIGSK